MLKYGNLLLNNYNYRHRGDLVFCIDNFDDDDDPFALGGDDFMNLE